MNNLLSYISAHKKLMIIIILLIVLTGYFIWLIYENTIINVTHYDVSSKNIPKEFNNFKIAQISDFHNTVFGENNETLLLDLELEKPDIIVITGDYIDCRHTDLSVAESLTKRLVRIAPVYYCTGNHESRIPDELKKLEKMFEKNKVNVLRNNKQLIKRGKQSIRICGIDDPDFLGVDMSDEDKEAKMTKRINALKKEDGKYCILLSHRPELFDIYCKTGVGLALTGHAHGGQIRLPFIGPVFSPSEGLFPKYAEGMHTNQNTTMVVSRGLGQSQFPLRINNSPELVIVTLHNQ